MDTIISRAKELTGQLSTWRRFLHRHAEVGWTEYVTTAYLVRELTALGYEIHTGRKILGTRLGLPTEESLCQADARATAFGVDSKLYEQMAGGYTGLCAVLRTGRAGKTVCLRFDIDANDLTESTDPSHRPTREGFSSQYPGAMHACGHDGHMAIGLGVATLLAERADTLSGTVMLLFQPAEEGVRGGHAIASSGWCDKIDELYGLHLGFALRQTGRVAVSTTDFLATTKIDATFTGKTAHAGASPDGGQNALLAAATATLELHAMPRRAGGISRINVGTLSAGEGRNTIPAHAQMTLEVRGSTSDVCDAMARDAERILSASAMMHDVQVETAIVGHAASFTADSDLALRTEQIARRLGVFTDILPSVSFGASEDFSCLAEAVQASGGKANYLLLGSQLAAGHHCDRFDFDEDALPYGVALLTALVTQP